MKALALIDDWVCVQRGDNDIIHTLHLRALKQRFKRSYVVLYMIVDKRRFVFSQLALRICLFPKKVNPYLIDAPSVINVRLLTIYI